MRLSALQRDTLRVTYELKTRELSRPKLEQALARSSGKALTPAESKILTRSLERLIDNGLLIGTGVRTMQKWYIDSIRLTPEGRAVAKRMLGQQRKLEV